MPAPVAHRRALEAPRREPVRGEPGRVQIRRDVRDPHGSPEVADVLEQHGALRPLRGALMLLVGQAGGDAFPSAPGLVDPHDRGVAGLRPFTRAPADFVGDGPGTGACPDAKACRAEVRQALTQRLAPRRPVVIRHPSHASPARPIRPVQIRKTAFSVNAGARLRTKLAQISLILGHLMRPVHSNCARLSMRTLQTTRPQDT